MPYNREGMQTRTDARCGERNEECQLSTLICAVASSARFMHIVPRHLSPPVGFCRGWSGIVGRQGWGLGGRLINSQLEFATLVGQLVYFRSPNESELVSAVLGAPIRTRAGPGSS